MNKDVPFVYTGWRPLSKASRNTDVPFVYTGWRPLSKASRWGPLWKPSRKDVPQPERDDSLERESLEQMDTDFAELIKTQEEVILTDQDEFLRKIHPKFLQLVQPQDSGLMDMLRQDQVMSSDDEKSVMAKETRRDRSRQLWKFLRRVPPERFEESCVPALRTLYPHVLEGVTFRHNALQTAAGECFRHVVMKRMSVQRFADVFVPTNACTFEEYNYMTGGGGSENQRWEVTFRLCASNADNKEFSDLLRNTLQPIGVLLPDNLPHFLASGFPCCCGDKPGWGQELSLIANGKENARHRRTVHTQKRTDGMFLSPQKRMRLYQPFPEVDQTSSCGYPCTLNSTAKGSSSVSLSSHQSSGPVVQNPPNTKFESKEQKDAYMNRMRKVNEAMDMASSIRPLARQLSAIIDEFDIINTDHGSKTEVSFQQEGQRLRLTNKGISTFESIQEKYKRIGEIRDSLESEEKDCQDRFPDPWNARLLIKKQLLGNEVKEADAFFKQAESMRPTARWVTLKTKQ